LDASPPKELSVNDTVTSDSDHDTDRLPDQSEASKFLLECRHGRLEVEWDNEAKVTPVGSLVFFAQFLQTGGLMDRLCQKAPLVYTSPNAPKPRDVLGTLVLSILHGQTRYAHINALRGDRVSSELLGVSKVVSEDSVRRALGRSSAEAWDSWLMTQERAVYEPLLAEDYVLDIDNTVKSLYGHQEGAEVGYHPQKPGRPNHNYHTYFVGSARLILGVEVMPGKKHSGKHSMPGLWRMLDHLPVRCRPRLVRGDVSYGNEDTMAEAESRLLPYLFKLRQTAKVRHHIDRLERDAEAWRDAGDGWQGTEMHIELMGWSKSRRCIFLRRPAGHDSNRKALTSSAEPEFIFMTAMETEPIYEYIVLVTNDESSIEGLGQLYRDRADCENVFDEIKNQWGWTGYVTRDIKRCGIMARLIALVYNWWNVFTRLARPDQHMEAITSRPLLLHAVGRMVTTGRRTILRLTSAHAMSDKIRHVLHQIGSFLNAIKRTAEQLSVEAAWALILSAAFIKWLRGKVLHPVSEQDQIMLGLT
jgi:hypothetical protein